MVVMNEFSLVDVLTPPPPLPPPTPKKTISFQEFTVTLNPSCIRTICLKICGTHFKMGRIETCPM